MCREMFGFHEETYNKLQEGGRGNPTWYGLHTNQIRNTVTPKYDCMTEKMPSIELWIAIVKVPIKYWCVDTFVVAHLYGHRAFWIIWLNERKQYRRHISCAKNGDKDKDHVQANWLICPGQLTNPRKQSPLVHNLIDLINRFNCDAWLQTML